MLGSVKRYLEYCKRCGFCIVKCPVSQVFDGLETFSPRGRVLLLYGMSMGELKATISIAEKLFSCTLCGYCTIKCPAGLELEELFSSGRRTLNNIGLVPGKIAEISRRILESGNPYNAPLEEREFWTNYIEEAPRRRGSVALWLGCTTAYRRMDTCAAAYSLLKTLGVDVAIVEDERCCGAPLYYAGYLKEFKDFLKQAIMRVMNTGADTIVTPCPSCMRAFKEYSAKVGLNHGLKVYHLVEYLGKLYLVKPIPRFELEARVTYHDPCELGRHLGIYDEPRKLIESVRGVKFIEMSASRKLANCCGGGGLYLAMNPDNSIKIAVRRLEDVPPNVEVLATACPSCEVMLSIAVERLEADIEVLDIADLLWRALSK